MKKAELKRRRELRKSGLKGKKLEEALKYPAPQALAKDGEAPGEAPKRRGRK